MPVLSSCQHSCDLAGAAYGGGTLYRGTRIRVCPCAAPVCWATQEELWAAQRDDVNIPASIDPVEPDPDPLSHAKCHDLAQSQHRYPPTLLPNGMFGSVPGIGSTPVYVPNAYRYQGLHG